MKNLKTIWEIEIGKMLKDLYKIALADGTITHDERDLMQTVNQDINKFVKAYRKALDDHIITQKESDILKNIWVKIYDNAEDTAKTDEIITSDEQNMLIRIAESVIER